MPIPKHEKLKQQTKTNVTPQRNYGGYWNGVFINNYGQSHNCRGKCKWSIFYYIQTEKEKLFGLENCMHRAKTYKMPIEQIKCLIAKKSREGWSKCSQRMENGFTHFRAISWYDSTGGMEMWIPVVNRSNELL